MILTSSLRYLYNIYSFSVFAKIMKLLSPVTYRSKKPSANFANNMLDMMCNSPLYLTISPELKTVLFKCVEGIAIDTLEWNNLMEEYLQSKKRYEQYPFSYACFETTINAIIHNSVYKNKWKWSIQLWDNQEVPWILTVTDPNKLLTLLQSFWTLPFNEQILNWIYSTHTATVQCVYEIVKQTEQENLFNYGFSLFVQLDRGMQNNPQVFQLILHYTVPDLQTLYSVFIQIIPTGVSIKNGLQIIKNNKLLEQAEFVHRATDDEQYDYAKMFDSKLWMVLDAYRDKTVSQQNKEELFERICQNEWWCYFIKQAKTIFTFSKLELIIRNRPIDTFRLFSPDRDWKKALITFEW